MSEVQVYRVFIKATPQAIWDAITQPEWTQKYGYKGMAEYDLRPGGSYRALTSAVQQEDGTPAVAVEGEVLEADPPHKLVTTWRATWLGEMTRVTYEIDEDAKGVSSLTITHELDGAPQTAAQAAGKAEAAGGGWAMVISDMKSVLETGASMYA